MNRVICVLAAGFAVGLALPSRPLSATDIVADSVLEFSGTQGQDNWFYGYYDGPLDPTSFQQMTVFDNFTWYLDPNPPSPFVWTLLNTDGGHPNGTTTSGGRDSVEHWAVRRWVSEVDGLILLCGNIADLDDGGNNGIIGRIFVDNSEIYNATIDNGDFAGVDYAVNATVAVGTTIDFVIDPRSSDDLFDASRFTIKVHTMPEPSTLLLTIGGAIMLLGFHRRQHRSASLP